MYKLDATIKQWSPDCTEKPHGFEHNKENTYLNELFIFTEHRHTYIHCYKGDLKRALTASYLTASMRTTCPFLGILCKYTI